MRPLVLGADGQLGRALAAALPDARGVTRSELDVTDAHALESWPWARARRGAQRRGVHRGRPRRDRRRSERRLGVNADRARARLARLAARHGFTLVHYSTDYVFDGSRDEHDEDEPLTPLGVYGQSKAAGDVAVGTAPRHYVVRTSWVVGDGANFVRTMARLADEGVTPDVVADQVGRLTFTDEIVRATRHLLDAGRAVRHLPRQQRRPPDVVGRRGARGLRAPWTRPATTSARSAREEYAAGRALAPRPPSSVLSTSRIEATGFRPVDAREALRAYASSLP